MATIRLHDVTKIFTGAHTGPKFVAKRARDPAIHRHFTETLTGSGPVTALDHVTLTIPNGSTLAVVGPSGCGKSTLLRVIAGLTDYRGDVFYDAQNVNELVPGDRYIGMVFQDYALYPHFAGHGNLRFFFDLHKTPDAEAEERIRVTSEIMGIGFKELLKYKPGALSGGQRQRIAIGRALVRKPKLFLFDEPLSNLDAKLRTQTRVEIKRLLHRFEITAIYVTHDQLEAIAIGDAIAVMQAGRIVQMGTFQELLNDPGSAFVAGFLGLPPMNLFKGTVRDGALDLGTLTVPLLGIAAHAHNGQAVTLGIRPETVAVHPGERASAAGIRLEGTIDVIEPDFGRRRQVVYAHTDDLSYSVIASLDLHLAQGYPLPVVFPFDALYFFDTESDNRIRAS